MVSVYGIKNCDSVKKALKFFKTHGIVYTLTDFKTDPVGCETVDRWLQHTDIWALLNSRGTTYRTLGLKAMALDEVQQREWLCRENLLIKRPVIEYENNVIIGFDEPLYQGVFCS